VDYAHVACRMLSVIQVRVRNGIEIQRCVVLLDDAPNYYPNSFSGPEVERGKLDSQFSASGDVARYNTADDDNFTQVGNFWRKVRHFSHCSC